MKRIWILFLTLTLCLPSLQSQQADFGDAPETGSFLGKTFQFNTTASNQGPRHTAAASSTFWLGRPDEPIPMPPSVEADALLPDADADDGRPFIFVLALGVPAPASVFVPITTSASHNPATPIYINVAIDVDHDLDFDDARDVNWVVRNMIVYMDADTSLWNISDYFGFGSDLLLFPVWARISVTDQPVKYGWATGDVANVYTVGETEDWCYGPSPVPILSCAPPSDSQPQKPNVRDIFFDGRIFHIPCGKKRPIMFPVTNRSKVPVKDLQFDFTFLGGDRLPIPPTVIPRPVNLAPGETKILTFCVQGWPCPGPDDPHHRKAVYYVRWTYDPKEEYYQFSEKVTFSDAEDPDYVDGNFKGYLPIEPTGVSPHIPWRPTVGPAFVGELMTWTGYYPGPVRWIEGDPTASVIRMPSWMQMTQVPSSTGDTTLLRFTGTPGPTDAGIDSLILAVYADSSADVITMDTLRYAVPLYVTYQGNPPTFTDTLAPWKQIQVFNTLSHTYRAFDMDLAIPGIDTLLFAYQLQDVQGRAYSPINPPKFEVYGNDSVRFEWKPDSSETGQYQLRVFVGDYYQFLDTSTTQIAVTHFGVGLSEPLADELYFRLFPNPFEDKVTVEISLPHPTDVVISIVDMQGRKVNEMQQRRQALGLHRYVLKLDELPDGVYLVEVITDGHSYYQKGIKLP